MTFQTEPRDHRFFGIVSVLAAVAIVLGFGNTYGAKLVGGIPVVPRLIHVHALVFACWLALFITQIQLVSRGRLDLHRRVGAAGMVLAGLMLILGVEAGIAVARRGHLGIPGVMFPNVAGFLLLNIAATVVFFTLTVAGFLYRASPQTHKRLMLMAVVGGLTPPGIARMPFIAGNTPATGALAIAFLLSGPIYDLVTRKRVHLAYVFGLVVAILGLPPIVAAVAQTSAWQSIAAWLIG